MKAIWTERRCTFRAVNSQTPVKLPLMSAFCGQTPELSTTSEWNLPLRALCGARFTRTSHNKKWICFSDCQSWNEWNQIFLATCSTLLQRDIHIYFVIYVIRECYFFNIMKFTKTRFVILLCNTTADMVLKSLASCQSLNMVQRTFGKVFRQQEIFYQPQPALLLAVPKGLPDLNFIRSLTTPGQEAVTDAGEGGRRERDNQK